ncbi:MAG: DNA-directed RNA polymerase subunit alpha [Candidatus Moranbacteria bacterium RIFOXYA12_FULL_44_15]|nr:MAG: DNA-directed RNA polymerase subunit alpha [Candidatus Moranbacteria bacterium RIFOXYA12_FULL_44_15]OGI35542.1 MAG: DNA-directed RNA polymerase subunit alpha [Candidatus Moranbacteria bacterium RIFOXYA2_FULL_43_15]
MQSITLPQKPKFKMIDEKTGNFEIEGCYPGYGTTLGNALRRVLLSSLSGAAITSVSIKGVKHEFSTIPNVLEDVIQVILNLKQVRFRLHKDESVKVQLKIKGEKKINAGMIECSSDVEVVNKDAHIATITGAKGEIEMEMEVAGGIGYVPVEQQNREKKEVGVIAMDAIYTPIKRVNYAISNMRVGKRTDFEKINLEIMTDGSIDPEEAFSKAVGILVDQFSVLKDVQAAGKEKAPKKEVVEEEAEKKEEDKKAEVDPKKVEITELKSLSTRTLNVLEKGNISKVGDILKLTEEQLGGLEGMGAKGIKEIKKAIGDFGVNLKKTE